RDLDVCACAVARDRTCIRHPDRGCCAFPALERNRLRRTTRRHREGRSFLYADVRPPCARIRRRHLHAAGAGRLVPERRETPRMSQMLWSSDEIEGNKIAEHRPWPRFAVNEDGWRFATTQRARGTWTLLGLWGDTGAVHMAVLDANMLEIAVLTLSCPAGHFPSVGALHPPAIRLERALRDLYGLEPVGLPDVRPWLDLGFWDVQHPLGDRRPKPGARMPYAFLPTEGDHLHQIPVGPVHAGIIEPGHFRFTANGETVVRLEQRLGYVHKGIESLMTGASLDKAARLAGRTSGDSTVAYALAFAQAVEAALNIEVPRRAIHLRALMAEFERLANH